MRLVLVVAVLPAVCVAMCPYIDGHWAVNYMRGQVSPDWWSCSVLSCDWSAALPPGQHARAAPRHPGRQGLRGGAVGRPGAGPALRGQVTRAHAGPGTRHVCRYILHVWDTRQRLMRYIYNSSDTVEAVVRVPRCAKLYVQVR